MERLRGNEQLFVGEGGLDSSEGKARLELLPEGLRITDTANREIWSSSGVRGRNAYRAIMQLDGNFVIYDIFWRPLWSTLTDGNPGAFVIMQNDENLVLYGPDLRVLWASNTNQRSAYAARWRVAAQRWKKKDRSALR